MTSFHKPILFGTFVLSCIGLALTLITISTSNWVVSTLKSPLFDPSSVNYGLFAGRHDRTFAANTNTYSLTMTCIFAENVCALSCYSTSAERNEEVTSLANGVKVPHSCSRLRFFASKTTEDSNEMEVIRSWSAGDKFELNDSEDAWIFINPYIWLFTIIFLSIGILVTIATSIISVMNVASNPIHIVLSIYGLFFWNGIACVLLFLVLLLWGIHFGTTISKNIAIRDTIVGDWSSDGLASLGYSYWFLVPAMIIPLINIGLLFFRQRMINKEAPKIQAPSNDQADGTIFLY